MKDFNEYNEYSYTADAYGESTVPEKKKNSTAKKIIITALCCSILGGACGAGGTVLAMKAMGGNNTAPASSAAEANAPVASDTSRKTDGGSTTLVTGTHSESAADSDSQPAITQTKANTDKLLTASEVYKANVNSTVGIRTSITTTNYWGYQTQAAASGSGFIISADGYILTNHHVIDDADSIKVTMYDGTTYDAALVGSDESNDVAVLKIDADGLTPVVLGSSEALEVGDGVVAIGNPLGELTFSLTAGVVSALDRTITTQSTTMELIQTDCAINSGNSGGPLFNMYGEVVGITNSKYSSSGMNEASIDNIAFAIPLDNIRPIIDSLIKDGYVTKPYIGVSLADLSSEALDYGLPQGAAVKSVTEGAPAEAAGVKSGDIITRINGEQIKDSNELIARVKKCSKGDQLELTVYRKGEEFNVTVTVDEKKQETEAEQKAAEEEARRKQQEEYRQRGGYDYDFPDFGSIFGY